MRTAAASIVRYSRSILAASVFVGLLLPTLAAALQPLITLVVISTLAVALLRIDWQRVAQTVRRPRLAASVCAWQLVLTPLLIGLLLGWLNVESALVLCLVLQASAPPIGSAPVFVHLLQVDGSLTIVVVVATVLLLPLTLTSLIVLLPANSVEIDLVIFFWRVTLMVVAPFAMAWLFMRWVGRAQLHANDDFVGCINLILLVIFAIGVMDGVTAKVLADPLVAAQLLLVACAMAVVLHLSAFLLFLPCGLEAAINAAICSGNRNMGLLLAITAGSAGSQFPIYVGLAQIPMYFAPLCLAFLLRRSSI